MNAIVNALEAGQIKKVDELEPGRLAAESRFEPAAIILVPCIVV
jgi:hypothetical protein